MYVCVSVSGGEGEIQREKERQFLVTKKDNNYFNVNET
jgi:hypothetical protein